MTSTVLIGATGLVVSLLYHSSDEFKNQRTRAKTSSPFWQATMRFPASRRYLAGCQSQKAPLPNCMR